MLTRIKLEDLPEGILSDHIKGEYKEYVVVKSLGVDYYVPLPKRVLSFLKKMNPNNRFNIEIFLEDWLRNVISALHLQVRDTVGAEVESSLSRQITESFSKMFQENLLWRERASSDLTGSRSPYDVLKKLDLQCFCGKNEWKLKEIMDSPGDMEPDGTGEYYFECPCGTTIPESVAAGLQGHVG